MTPVALAFAVLDASGDVSDLSLVLAAQAVPLLVLLLVGGVVADRFPRGPVLVAANVGAGLTQAAVAALLITGGYALGPVAALVALNGATTAFTIPALSGIVPELVDGDALQRANALLATSRGATRVLGPSVAGVVVATAGGGWALAVDAAGFLIAALCMARLRLPRRPPAGGGGVLRDLREGWTAFRSLVWVRTVVLAFTGLNFLTAGIWLVLGPVIARETIGEAAWGLVLGARAAGLLVMGALMYLVVARYLLRLGQLALLLGAVPYVLLGLGSSAGWLIAGAFAAGVGSAVFVVAWETSLHEHVPAGVRSRVTSYDVLGSYAAVPLGQLLVVPVAAAVGDRQVALLGGVVYAVLVLAVLASRSVRTLEHGPR